MNGSIGFFDRSADVGTRILNYLAGIPATRQDVADYLTLIATIYETFSQIHGYISQVTIDVSMATNLPEATSAMMLLRQLGLKDTFKAQDLCDELQELGSAIHNTLLTMPNLTGEDRAILDELSTQLMDREAGTARLYDEKLYDLRNLSQNATSLAQLQTAMDAASQQLVLQKARFDYLARKARAMLVKG